MVMLRDRVSRRSYTITLAEFRERIESQLTLNVNPEDWGSCGCYN